jgi:hypothetical protein
MDVSKENIMTMAMEAFEQSNGFSALTADELFFVNGGCSTGSRASSHWTSQQIQDAISQAIANGLGK